MKILVTALATAGLIAAAACQAPANPTAKASATPVACRADVPAELTLRPGRWIGECRDNAADGLGVLRAGAGAPVEFFAGRMRGGRLVDGVLILKSDLMMVAVRFDADRRVVVSDGLRPSEDEAVFRTATAAASSVSKRYAASGNRASAAYYAKLAERIRTAPPE